MKRMIAISCLTLLCSATASMAHEPAVKSTKVVRSKDAKAAATPSKDRRVIRLKDGEIYVDGDRVKRGFLGVRLISLTDELRAHYGTPKESGVLVSAVTSDSPAARAGVEVGDVITAFDGKPASSVHVVESAIRGRKAGDRVQIELVRNRTPRTLTASIDEREARLMDLSALEDLPLLFDSEKFRASAKKLEEQFNSPEWRARLKKITDCTSVQGRIKDLEKRLEDLEKKKN